MGIVKRSADLVYAFRFVKIMSTPFNETEAYKLGIIDENGKRNKNIKLDSSEKKSAYTPFIRLALNIKRLISKIPGGGSSIGGFASALYLMKENFNIKEKAIKKVLKEFNIDESSLLLEASEWFVLNDKMLSPGVYKVKNDKMLNITCEEIVNTKDQIRIVDDSYPVGDIFGISIYEATHIRTNQKIYVTANEIYK